MEKRQLMKNLLLLFFLIPMAAFAQNGTEGTAMTNGKIIDLDKSGDLLIDEDGDCVPYTKVTVNLSHLVQFENNQYGIEQNPLNLEPLIGGGLFLHYQIGSVVGQQELDNTFEHLLNAGLEIPVFSKEFKIYLDVNEAHSSCTIGNNIPFMFRILNADGNIIPLFDYGNSGGIFDCGYFDKTACNCTESCQGNGTTANYWTGKLKNGNFCVVCGPQSIPNILRSDNNFDTDLRLSPNPFKEFTKLELKIKEDSSIEVAIYDVSGKIMANWKEQVNKGDYTKELQTSDWQNGIYFGKMRIGDKVESFQIVKID